MLLYTCSNFNELWPTNPFLIFVLVFVSRDSELDQNLSGDFRKKFYSDLYEIWYVRMTVYRMARSKVEVKVTCSWKFKFIPFLKPISSAIYNGSCQMTI